MIEPRLFLCSDTKLSDDDPRRTNRRVVELATLGDNANVNVKLEDVARVILDHLSPRLIDLIEIASYVYTADCATRRGEQWTDEASTEAWSRDFYFIIPVRDIGFWNDSGIRELLTKAASFLSNDTFTFDFVPLTENQLTQQYLDVKEEDWPFYEVDRVLMFSGGLDSLAGAVVTASQGEKLVLVSHRPIPKISKRQKTLYQELKTRFCNPIIHIPVWVNKIENFGREHSQRTRSFLYASLGLIVAASVRAKGVSFFENGIVSLNLPVADEVLRARASRTTNPLALKLLSDLFSAVVEREFVVDNPFLYYTKAEVVSLISKHDMQDLIPLTCSCAHTIFKSKVQEHCGTCSQCIDRRIAIMATELTDYDPETDYEKDVFSGGRDEGYQQNMAIGYVRHAIELNKMSEEEISSRFNLELMRAARPFPNKREVLEMFTSLHKRHASTVASVLQMQMGKYSGSIINGEIEKTSMLALVAGREHLMSSWIKFTDRVISLLQIGLPIACETRKPENEAHTQQLCDAILKSKENDLGREFPFMRWSSSLTKPDWSSEQYMLWIELKYVRERRDIRVITEDIAADITKYGDNKRRVLFIIYDPYHIVIDEMQFAQPIVARVSMRVAFIR